MCPRLLLFLLFLVRAFARQRFSRALSRCKRNDNYVRLWVTEFSGSIGFQSICFIIYLFIYLFIIYYYYLFLFIFGGGDYCHGFITHRTKTDLHIIQSNSLFIVIRQNKIVTTRKYRKGESK